MKNAGLTIGMVAIGIGLASIGFNLNGNQAVATPAAYNAGPEEPTIVWYDSHADNMGSQSNDVFIISMRGWSDGTLEAKFTSVDLNSANSSNCEGVHDWSSCLNTRGWVVISSPTEGLNAAADINFDEVVDGADMGLLLGNWGKAPRSPIPASDCPLGLMQ